MPTIDPFGKLLETKLRMDALEQQRAGQAFSRERMEQQMAREQATRDALRAAAGLGTDISGITDPTQLRQARASALSDITRDYPQADIPPVQSLIGGFGGISTAAGQQAFAPQKMVDAQGNIVLGVPVFDKATGNTVMQPLGMEGYTPVAETYEQKRAGEVAKKRDILTAEQEAARKTEEEKKLGGKRGERIDAYITAGQDAADSIANVKRSLQILDYVETGGIDKASLFAKQFFGVESGDEAELSANLGKNVLAQLKPVFGAQFTENEGKRLERIEANFGKSTSGNKRLLNQALQIAERAAKRGIKYAKETNQPDIAQEIQDALDFKLTDLGADIRGQAPTGAAAQIDNAAAAVKQQLPGIIEKQITAAPQAAIDYLRANPQFKQQFIDKYGTLPEGF